MSSQCLFVSRSRAELTVTFPSYSYLLIHDSRYSLQQCNPLPSVKSTRLRVNSMMNYSNCSFVLLVNCPNGNFHDSFSNQSFCSMLQFSNLLLVFGAPIVTTHAQNHFPSYCHPSFACLAPTPVGILCTFTTIILYITHSRCINLQYIEHNRL